MGILTNLGHLDADDPLARREAHARHPQELVTSGGSDGRDGVPQRQDAAREERLGLLPRPPPAARPGAVWRPARVDALRMEGDIKCMCMCMLHVHVHVACACACHVCACMCHMRPHMDMEHGHGYGHGHGHGLHMHMHMHMHMPCVCLLGVAIEAAPSCLGRGAPLRRREVVLLVAPRLGVVSSG